MEVVNGDVVVTLNLEVSFHHCFFFFLSMLSKIFRERDFHQMIIVDDEFLLSF